MSQPASQPAERAVRNQADREDWRSHFDLLGLRYTKLAAVQAQAISFNGRLPMGMFELEHNIPPADLSQSLSFLPLSPTNGATLWKDGGSPTQCPQSLS